jgi:hypothetical protein
MVFGVFWVGVDLGPRLENEPRLARLLDDVGFRDITGSGARVRTLGRAVLFDGDVKPTLTLARRSEVKQEFRRKKSSRRR